MIVTVAGREIELKNEERQECEIWTRVMGYYRPMAAFNIGKKQEADERIYFTDTITKGGTE